MVRIKRKIGEIKLYEYNINDSKFYRAKMDGISSPGRTINSAIKRLLETYKQLNG